MATAAAVLELNDEASFALDRSRPQSCSTRAASGFENFFRELSEILAAGPPDPEQLMPLAARYGLQFGQPDWLPDVIARYNLTPPM